MRIKTISIVLLSSILLFNCNSKTTDKQDNSETIIVVTNATPALGEPSVTPINHNVTDTTNYLADCLYETLINGERSFKDIEKSLLDQNILKNTTPKGYKDFFITYVIPEQFGRFNNMNTYKVDKQFFQNKLKIATILRAQFKSPEQNTEDTNACPNNQFKKKGFENSSVKALLDESNEITDQLVAGTLDSKYKTETYNMLNKHFSVELFKNIDSRVISYVQLNDILKEYGEDQMDDDYTRTLDLLEDYKKNGGKEIATDSSTKQKATKGSENQPEIILMTTEETEKSIKNGAVIKSTDPDNN
ncbi:hypothetical protein JBL43_00385 [Aureibaculum sp. A20]|uniref:DUF4296 domain-containing protein n=1 Tax=Aureibaculum flavum TaxID=2795986 RepID=A0ABS0WL64_9FLAO|nr:hypothetical protein [Aureibaculum flavum]MBJ2172674.1 hypothetical protein [Aureibaculum flavum]